MNKTFTYSIIMLVLISALAVSVSASTQKDYPSKIPFLSSPKSLKAVAVSSSQVDLKWNYPNGKYDFRIYRVEGKKTKYVLIGTTKAEGYSDKSVKPNTKYKYKVQAVVKNRVSHFSNVAMATTPKEVIEPCSYDSTRTIKLCTNMLNNSVKVNLSTKINNSHYTLIDVDNSLVGWWRMEDDTQGLAEDSTQYNNDGSIAAAPSILSGIFGKGFGWEGAVDYAPIFLQESDSLKVTDKMTLSAWINITGNQINPIILYGYGGPYSLLIDTSTNPANLIFYRVDSSIPTPIVSVQVPLPSFTEGEWHNVAVVVRDSISPEYGSKAVEVYFDGVGGYAQGYSGISASAYPTSIYIGGDMSYHRINGQIDELLLFNRALSEAEVKSLYDAKANPLKTTYALPAGNHTIKAYAVDANGNLYSAPAKTINIASFTPVKNETAAEY